MLGPLEVRRDGQPVAVPGGKSAELLVRLALDGGATVRTDRLDRRGVGRPRSTPAATPCSRRSLGCGARSEIRRSSSAAPTATASTVDPDRIDAFVGRTRRGGVGATPARRRSPRARPTPARRRWRGSPTRSSPPPVTPSGSRRTGPGSKRSGPQLDRDPLHRAPRPRATVDDVIADLEAAVAAFPFHEALWQLLITALYRAGRQADALAAYQRVRALLADELGLEPGPGLRQLEQQILVHDAALGVDVSPRRQARSAPPDGKPAVDVGRARRTRRATSTPSSNCSGASGSSSSSGAGGVGKTALAIAAARDWSTRIRQPRRARGSPGSRPPTTADEVTTC